MKSILRSLFRLAAAILLCFTRVSPGDGATLVRTIGGTSVVHAALPASFGTLESATDSVSAGISMSGSTGFSAGPTSGFHSHTFSFIVGPYSFSGSTSNESVPPSVSHSHRYVGFTSREYVNDRTTYFTDSNQNYAPFGAAVGFSQGHSHSIGTPSFSTTTTFRLRDIEYGNLYLPLGYNLNINLAGEQFRATGLVRDGNINVTDGTLSISTGDFINNGGSLTINGNTAAAMPTLELTQSAQALGINLLTVGDSNAAAITIDQGSSLATSTATLGAAHSGAGDVKVDGAGSTWTTGTANLGVGREGSGTLTISNGGEVTSGDAYLAAIGSNSTGVVVVTGAGSKWTGSDGIQVGRNGNGTLTISAGGQVSDVNGNLASGADAVGVATVTGAGSKWTNSNLFQVGVEGDGNLTISDGGEVINAVGRVAGLAGSISSVDVTGSGSKWSNSGGLYIGGTETARGGSASLTVADGGEVTAGGALKIWHDGVLTLDGGSITAGSFDRAFGTFHHHDGTLTVAGGNYVHYSAVGLLTLDGNDDDAHSHLVLDAVPTSTGISGLVVGDGRRGSLTVKNGSEMAVTGYAHVGDDAGAFGDVTVDGAQWNVEQLIVAVSGKGTLTIDNGATVNSFSGTIGANIGATGDVVVSDAGSHWISSGEIRVGDLGTGTLSILAGQVTAPTVTVGGTLANNGTIGGDVQLNGGTLSGSGQVLGVATVNAGGVIAPGTSPGTLTVGGLVLMPEGSLEIEIGATANDQIVISGEASLGGILNVSLLDGFALTASESFDILDWGSIDGSFACVNLPTLSGGLQWDISQLYTTGVLSVSLHGDFNADGLVDAADYTVWRDGLGGAYDESHYDLWKQNFDAPNTGGAAADSRAVPEPAMWMLVPVGLMSSFRLSQRGIKR